MADEGTAEWFQKARYRCIDHLRALLSIRMARECIEVILSKWDLMPPTVSAALHSNCVIAYARPFTSAMTTQGKVRYPVKELRSISGFDRELHDHIMDLRDRIVAHSDYAIFPSTMFLQAVGDENLPISLGLNVKGLMGIGDKTLAERYEKHLSCCANAVERALTGACTRLTEQARLYPAVFHKTHNMPVTVQEIDATGAPAIVRPAGPAAAVPNPSFTPELSGYRYLMLMHEVPLIKAGKYKVTVNGVASEIEFIVGGSSEKHDKE